MSDHPFLPGDIIAYHTHRFLPDGEPRCVALVNEEGATIIDLPCRKQYLGDHTPVPNFGHEVLLYRAPEDVAAEPAPESRW